jgi:hypothetical protein
MAKYPFNSRRSRMNPVGGDSYTELFVDQDLLREMKDEKSEGGRFKRKLYPREFGGTGGQLLPSGDETPWVEDRSIPGTRALPATKSYANRIFRVQTYESGKGPVSYRVSDTEQAPVKGGLAAFLDGWTEADETHEKGNIYSRQYSVSPRVRGLVAAGGTKVDYWSGGFDALKKLGADWLTDSGSDHYTFQNLAPWSPSNPGGTGVWRNIGAQILAQTVRGDEAYAAQWLLRNKISPALRQFTRGQLKADALKSILLKNFRAICQVIFGDDAAVIIDEAHRRGVESVQDDVVHAGRKESAREERKAGVAAPGRDVTSRAGASILERARQSRLQQAASSSDPRLAPSRPAVAQVEPSVEAPPAVVRAVETAAAAITAPVTPAAPAAAVAGGALQSLLALGISLEDAQWIMSLPPAQRIGAMRVAMGN